jgi:hypothetical protein
MPAMAAEKTRIAVVGAGHVAQVAHIPAYRANPDVELVAIVDYDPVKAKRIKAQFGSASGEDFQHHAPEVRRPRRRHLHAQTARPHGHRRASGGDVVCEPMARNAKKPSRWWTPRSPTTAF